MTAHPVPWGILDFWRSYIAALAIEHGDDPDDAAAKHMRWCEGMGIEQNDGTPHDVQGTTCHE